MTSPTDRVAAGLRFLRCRRRSWLAMTLSAAATLAALALLAASSTSFAETVAKLASQTPPPVAAVSAPAAPAANFVHVADFDAGALLPPPPAPGSAQEQSELAELRALQATRTPAAFAHARADNVEEDVFIFADVMGPGFTEQKLPRTAAFFRAYLRDIEEITAAAKKHFARARPYALDTTISGCTPNPDRTKRTSYPSGHAAIGYGAAVILAALVPAKAPAILARARDYSESRLVCGAHYRSDIQASEALATLVAVEAMKAPAARTEMAAVAAELRKAGL